MKTISFVVPAYNSAGFLQTCIPSLLAEPVLKELEIIIVNDGSTDDTAAAAEQFCRSHPGVVCLINQENKGHGGALNTGCAAATGRYLKVVDADDTVETEELPKLVSRLRDCTADVVVTHYRTVDISSGDIRCCRTFPETFDKSLTLDEVMSDYSRFDRGFTFHGMIYRTEFYQKQGISLAEHVFYEDHQYATYPCCHAASVLPLDLFLYRYRIGDVNQSVSHQNQLRRIGQLETVLNRMTESYLELPESAGKRYAAEKIRSLTLSYMSIALLLEPDRSKGRLLAESRYAACLSQTPEIASLILRKYQAFLLMNRLQISWNTWGRISGSRLYNRLRGNRTFD